MSRTSGPDTAPPRLAAARVAGLPALREAPSAHTTEALEQAAREQATTGVTLGRDQPMRYDTAKVQREEREFDLAAAILVPSSYVEHTFLDRGFAPERLARSRYGFDPGQFPAPVPRDIVGRATLHRTVRRAGRAHQRAALRPRGLAPVGRRLPQRALPDRRDLRARLRGSARPAARPSERGAHGAYTDDVGAEMRAADVLVLASVTEGSALVTYEAQASGAALLVSDATGAYVEHGVQGLVHPARDVAMLADHLRAVSTDGALLARLRAGALAQRDELTWSTAAKVLVADYEARARC